ncbi:MAG: hypothetical protein LBC88_06990 [Spirochaetaceae bacterium]|jgi:hypothetical protein|nr:hypothetical protein [Spirochaetaceae bacterium]
MKRWFMLMSVLWCAVLLEAQTRPAWVDRRPADTTETVYFRALADGAETREDAERAAINSLYAEAASTVMVSVSTSVRERAQTTQRGVNGVLGEQTTIELESATESYSAMLLSGIKTESYSEPYTGVFGRRLFRAWALGAMPRRVLEAEIAAFPEKISARYAALIAAGGSMAADIRNRESIMNALDRTPLHRDVAWLDTAEGRVNLYDYLASQIQTWAGSIAFAPIGAQRVRRGESLVIPVTVSSRLYPVLGEIAYRVHLLRLSGGGGGTLVYNSTTIDTSSLPAGTYRGSVEARLSGLSPALRDITREFSLEIALPAPPDKPFARDALGGVWTGTLPYRADGRQYRDQYIIGVYDDGTCWVAVAAEDGAAQSGTGYWSGENGVLHLDCGFENPAITRLPALRWAGEYALQNNNRRLRLNIKPAPDYPGVVPLTLNRER